MTPARANGGFTLVEVLVALGVIGVLIGLLLPAVQTVRHSAQRTACANQLKQIGLAAANYDSAHGCLPPAAPAGPRSPEALISPLALLLPFLELDSLYDRALVACALDTDAAKFPPHEPFVTPVRAFICPADPRLNRVHADPTGITAAYGSFVGISAVFSTDPTSRKGQLGVFGGRFGLRFTDVADGTSTTILLGERPPPDNFSAGWWYPEADGKGYTGPNNALHLGPVGYIQPMDCAVTNWGLSPGRTANPCDRYHLWSLHPGGANFLFVDGSVHFIPYSARAIIPALATISGGESVELP